MASKLDKLLKEAKKNNILQENEEKVQEVKVEQPAAETKPAEPEQKKQVSVEQAQVAAEKPTAEAETVTETAKTLKELFVKPLPAEKCSFESVRIPTDLHKVISTLASAGNVSITNLYILILRDYLGEHEKEVNKLIMEEAKKNLFKL